MNKRVLFVVVVMMVAAGAMPVAGQRGQIEEEVLVRVMNLEAVVHDRDGVRVPGLTRDDFDLYVNGEPVEIDYFTEIRNSQVIDSATGHPVLEDVAELGANFLIFIDEFFPIKRDLDTVLTAISERLGDNMRPFDRVAVVAWNGEGIDRLSDWTSSADEAVGALQTALERDAYGLRRQQERRQFLQNRDDFANAASQRGFGDMSDPTDPTDPRGNPYGDDYRYSARAWDSRWRLGTQERAYADLLSTQISGAVAAASASMRAIETPRGRNVLVILSGGWPWNPSQYVAGSTNRNIGNEPLVKDGLEVYGPITETANLMGYTIYAIDVPGQQQARAFDPTIGGTTPGMDPGVGGSDSRFVLEMEMHNSLQFMADETGGLALINSQRIEALPQIGADVDSYYWLGFTPTWDADDEFREIRLEPANPELRARTRAGYRDISRPTQVAMAIERSLYFGGGVSEAELPIEVGEIEREGRRDINVPLTISVPLSQFNLLENDDGSYVAQIALIVTAIDEEGAKVDIPIEQLVLTVSGQPRADTMGRYTKTLDLRRRGHTIAVALADFHSDATLVRTIRIEPE